MDVDNLGGAEGLVVDPVIGATDYEGNQPTDDQPIDDQIVDDQPGDDKPVGFDFNNTSFGEESAVDLTEFDSLQDLGVDTNSDIFKDDVSVLVGQGFTKEQISYLYGDFGRQAIPTPESIQESLAANLNPEQKRDYRPVGRMLLDSLPEDQHGLANQIMSDPSAVAILHSVYKKYVVGGRGANSTVQTSREVVGVTFDEALTEYKKYVSENTSGGKRINREELNSLKKDLLSRVDDKNKLNMFLN